MELSYILLAPCVIVVLTFALMNALRGRTHHSRAAEMVLPSRRAQQRAEATLRYYNEVGDSSDG